MQLLEQRDFYLPVKLLSCGFEISALGVATTLGHGWRFPQADTRFLRSPARPSPLLPVTQADLVWGPSPTTGLWRRGLRGSPEHTSPAVPSLGAPGAQQTLHEVNAGSW